MTESPFTKISKKLDRAIRLPVLGSDAGIPLSNYTTQWGKKNVHYVVDERKPHHNAEEGELFIYNGHLVQIKNQSAQNILDDDETDHNPDEIVETKEWEYENVFELQIERKEQFGDDMKKHIIIIRTSSDIDDLNKYKEYIFAMDDFHWNLIIDKSLIVDELPIDFAAYKTEIDLHVPHYSKIKITRRTIYGDDFSYTTFKISKI